MARFGACSNCYGGLEGLEEDLQENTGVCAMIHRESKDSESHFHLRENKSRFWETSHLTDRQDKYLYILVPRKKLERDIKVDGFKICKT